MSQSLRDSYINPSHEWSFNVSSYHSNSTKIQHWSPKQTPADLLAYLNSNSEPSHLNGNLTRMLQAQCTLAMLQFASTTLAMPWEVGRLLCQVQYIPKDSINSGGQMDGAYVEEESSDMSSNENEEHFFTEDFRPTASQSLKSRNYQKDDRGYIVRKKLTEHSTRPHHILPIDNTSGVWSMMKRLNRFRSEGFLALFKGLFTSSIIDFTSASLESLVRFIVTATLAIMCPSINSFPLSGHILIPIASHFLTGFALSPLDLVRTRLIVQSSDPRYKRYKGPLDALLQILRDEGGVKSVYFHPHLLYPTLLDCAARPIIGFGMPLLVAQILGPRITEQSYPLFWSVAQLMGATFGLIFTLPLETVRRRLQVQARGNAAAIHSCVEVNPKNYYGVIDAIVSIARDETCRVQLNTKFNRFGGREEGEQNKTAKMQRNNSQSFLSLLCGSGFCQLYHGLTTRVFANALIAIGPFLALRTSDDGWTEL